MSPPASVALTGTAVMTPRATVVQQFVVTGQRDHLPAGNYAATVTLTVAYP